MLELEHLAVSLPGTGVVVDGLSLTASPGQLWGVVGRTGSGGSTLLRAIAGSLPAGALTRGRVRTPRGRVLHVADLPPVGVADYLGAVGVGPSEVEALGLGHHLAHRITALPPDLRAACLLAGLRGAPDAAVVLVDACLTAAHPAHRRMFADELRRRADAGALVLWADHDLDALWSVADHVLELDRGIAAYAGTAPGWQPRTLPEPTLRTLARLLGTDVADSRTPERMRALLERPPAPGARPGRRGPARASSTIIPAADVGLRGAALEFGATETVGVIDVSGRVEPAARRMIGRLGGEVVGSPRWPAAAAMGTGHTARRRAARALDPTAPAWLPHIQAGLDPRERHDLATGLAGGPPASRIVTGRDVEFLVRACSRIVVLDGDEVVTVGAPHAVADHLPELPVVARALGSSRFLRITDYLGEGDR